MLFNYLTIIFEVAAHVFRAIGACAIILPISGFLGFVALDRCDGLTAILGLMAAIMAAIMAAVAVYTELESVAEDIRAWRISVKN